MTRHRRSLGVKRASGTIRALCSVLPLALGCNLILGNEPPSANGSGGDAHDGSGSNVGNSGGASGAGGTGGSEGECPCGPEETCVEGDCLPWECTPSEAFCSGDAVRTCDESGLTSTQTDACSEDEYCDAASVQCTEGVCAPSQPTCISDTTWRVCNDVGTDYEPGETPCPTNESCDAGACEPWLCMPGVSVCQGQDVVLCASNGLSSSVTDTCDGTYPVCVESDAGASCGECTPLDAVCSGGDLLTCDENGSWDSETCSDPDPFCTADACRPTPSVAENSIAYIGCTFATNIAEGYESQGGTLLWDTQDYDLGGMFVQSWAVSTGEPWTSFDEKMASVGGQEVVKAILVQICIGQTWPTDDELHDMLDSVRAHVAPDTHIFIFGQPDYTDDHECFISGSGGTDWTDAKAQELAADPAVNQNMTYLGRFLLDATTENSDGCHANTAGKLALGEQALMFLGQ